MPPQEENLAVVLPFRRKGQEPDPEPESDEDDDLDKQAIYDELLSEVKALRVSPDPQDFRFHLARLRDECERWL